MFIIHIHTHVISMKVRTNILIEELVLKKAKSLGINILKACENYLKILIDIMEQTNSQIKQQIKTNSEKKGRNGNYRCLVVDRAGFEPATS